MSAKTILDHAGGWEGVSFAEGRFGSTRVLVGRRELGHLHGESLLDLPLPPRRKAELLEAGRVRPHRFTPANSGWVSIDIYDQTDMDWAIELLREQYERAMRVKARRRNQA